MPPDFQFSTVCSPCGTWRYLLHRRLIQDALPPRICNFVMLNPSTADAVQDDPTIRRCIRFARAWGYSDLLVTNLFALRATDPRQLRTHPAPVGPENDDWLSRAAKSATVVVCAWGNHGKLGGRAAEVSALFEQTCTGPLLCLGATKLGEPRHPLYVSRTRVPTCYWLNAPITS